MRAGCLVGFVRIEVSVQKESDTLSNPNRPDVPPDTTKTPYRSVAASSADELSMAADLISWLRMPEFREVEQVAGLIIAVGFQDI